MTLLAVGTQDRYISETTIGSGSTSREGSMRGDSLVATLWVDSVTSGSLDISIYTLTDTGKQILLFSFPTVSAPTTNLLLKKSGASMQRFLIVANYSGIASYEVYIRSISGTGESSTQIIGASNWRTSTALVTTAPGILIPASLIDRNGVLIKNWSSTSTLYIADNLTSASTNITYPLAPKDAIAMDIAAGAEVYAVSDSGTADVRIVESGG